MRNKFDFKKDGLIWVMLILLFPLFGSCQKEELQKPLAGTEWLLVGFGEKVTGTLEPAKPEANSRGSFLLVFGENGKLDGYTATNLATGQYDLDYNNPGKISIPYFGAMTKINELYDGLRYIESMNKVSKYQFESGRLLLFYNSREYLLFGPKTD